MIVATPGRLVDILAKHSIPLSSVSFLITDEVDVMLQMGFEEQVQKIISQLPPNRQSLLFSATIPESTEKLSAHTLRDPISITVGNVFLLFLHFIT